MAAGLRLLEIQNPLPGILLARFNAPLRQNSELTLITNWVVTPVVSNGLSIEITRISARPSNPEMVLLEYTGGGIQHDLAVLNVKGADGSAIEEGYSKITFTLLYESELVPQIRLFNSVFGPMGVVQRTKTRRTIDDHVVSRSIAVAMDEQLRLKLQTLDGSIGRDGRPGKRRS